MQFFSTTFCQRACFPHVHVRQMRSQCTWILADTLTFACFQVDLECDVSRTQTVSTSFHANRTVVHEVPNPQVSGSTNYQTTVRFYTDGSFYKEVEGNPVSLRTGRKSLFKCCIKNYEYLLVLFGSLCPVIAAVPHTITGRQ